MKCGRGFAQVAIVSCLTHNMCHRAGFVEYGRDCAQAAIQYGMTYYICQRSGLGYEVWS